MTSFASLVKKLAQATGLSESMAQDVLQTAMDYVKLKRPDKAERVDAMLQDDAVMRQAEQMITKLSGAAGLASLRPSPHGPQGDHQQANAETGDE